MKLSVSHLELVVSVGVAKVQFGDLRKIMENALPRVGACNVCAPSMLGKENADALTHVVRFPPA